MGRAPLPLLAALLLALGCEPEAQEDFVPVRRDDLRIGVETTGALRAIHTDLLGPTPIPHIYEFKIASLSPEGAQVKQGDPVLGFDTSELQRMLEEKQHEASAVAKQIEKARLDSAMTRREEALRLAEAEGRQRKAALKVDRPTDLTGAIKLQTARLEQALADREVAYLRERGAAARRRDDAALAALRDQEQRASERVREIQAHLQRMKVLAPRAGTVIYASNSRDVKKKVGDSVWRAEKVLETADLSQMLARGEVDEADASRVAPGQRVTLRLDAHPDVEFSGRVQGLVKTVQRQSAKNPGKVLRLEIALERTDPLRMRPGMRFRGTIETERLSRVLLVPAAAVFLTAAGPVAYRRTATGVQPVPLVLGRRSRDLIEVREGLAEGDRVSRQDLGRAAARPKAGAGS